MAGRACRAPQLVPRSLVVGLTAGDGAGAIELLGQHQARELVRQRPGRELRSASTPRRAPRRAGRTHRPTTNADVARGVAGRGEQQLANSADVRRSPRSSQTRTSAPAGSAPAADAPSRRSTSAGAHPAAARLTHFGDVERPVARGTCLVLLDRRREMPVARLAHDGDDESHSRLRVDAAQPVHRRRRG